MLPEILITAATGLVILFMWLLRKPPRLWNPAGSFGPGSRRLGGFETMMARLGKKGEGNLCTIMFIRSKFPLTEVMVHRALTALSQKHPLLRIRLGKENGQYTYIEEMKDFRVNLEVCHTKDWKALMEDEAPKIYDAEKGPLWKVKFIPETSYEDGEEGCYPYQAACIFGFHHLIVDGPAFLRLFGELLDRLHAIKENDEQPVESRPLLPPLDAYIDTTKIYSPQYNLKINMIRALGMLTSFPPILRFLLRAITKPALFVKNLGVEIDRNPKAAKKMCLLPVVLTREQTSQLLASCKRHKTTVQCAIQTAACLAYSGMADGGKVTPSHNINCRLSVDLRRFLASQELTDYFGMYVSVFVMKTVVGPALSFWGIVSKVGADIQVPLKAHVPFLFFNMMTTLANTNEDSNPFVAASADLPGQRDMELDFHNYGNFNALNKDGSHCKLSGFFITGHLTEGGSVFGNALATVNGRLSWSFQYCSHICSKEQAEEYADMTIKTLLEAIKE